MQPNALIAKQDEIDGLRRTFNNDQDEIYRLRKELNNIKFGE